MNRFALLLLALFALSGCDARVMMTANLAVATVPCVMLFLTLNLKKD